MSFVAGSAASWASFARPGSPSRCSAWRAAFRATTLASRTRAAAASTAASGASAASGVSAVTRSDVGLPGRRGRHQARHDDVRTSLEPAHALGRRHRQPGVGRIERRQRRAERRVIVVLDEGTQRFGSHAAVGVGHALAQARRRRPPDRPSKPVTTAGARPRIAQNRTSADGSSQSLSRCGVGRRVARPEQRPCCSPADVHISGCRPAHDRRDVLARRESADREQRLADDGRGGGGGRCGGQVGGQRGPGLGRADLAERARRFLRDGGWRLGGREHCRTAMRPSRRPSTGLSRTRPSQRPQGRHPPGRTPAAGAPPVSRSARWPGPRGASPPGAAP